MRNLATLAALLMSLAAVTFFQARPAEAQLLLVTSRYRVVSVDRPNQRIGVALEDANPKVRQNWVYIKPDTNMSRRLYLGGGAFRDEQISFNAIWGILEQHRGKLVKVHGGRDWDGSIDAKTLWM